MRRFLEPQRKSAMPQVTKLPSAASDCPLIETLLAGTVPQKMTSWQTRPSVYQTRAGYYDRLMRVLRYAQTRQTILKDFLPSLPRRAAILEVGCGTGICTDALRDFYPDADIRGLDQSPEMLSIFRQRHPTIPVLAGDFNHPNLLDSHSMLRPATYDLILSAGALSEYGCYEAYAFVAGLLKERGIFLNIGIQRNAIGRLIGAVWGFHPSDPRAIMNTCRTVGFSVVSAYRLAWEWFPRTLIDVVIMAEKATKRSFTSSGGCHLIEDSI